MCKFVKKIILTFLMMGVPLISYADDIDVLGKVLPNDTNILFIMDLSGSMSHLMPSTTGDNVSRLDILKGAFQDIINDNDFNNINVGLSVFSGAYQDRISADLAHGITYPVSPIQGELAQSILSTESFTHPGVSYMPSAGVQNTREYLTSLSADTSIWSTGGGTAIVDALYEGVLYFRGEDVDSGRFFPDDVRSAHPSTYTGSLNKVADNCITETLMLTRSDSTGGTNCTTNIDNLKVCAEGATSCGLGTNCVSSAVRPATRLCDSGFTTIAECTSSNPTYHSCAEEPIILCTTGYEGSSTCNTTGVQIICKEDQTRYICDDVPDITYTCDFQVERCEPSPATGKITYKSPIRSECGSNGIILLTDGEPTSRKKGEEVKSLLGVSSCAMNDYNSDGQDDFSDWEWDPVSGQCGTELAEFMNNTDQNSAVTGTQTISLYTVGLSLAVNSSTSAYLYDLAEHGGGSFVAANDRAQLTAAFKQAILGIGKKAYSFSAPTYTVNTQTMLTHDKYVYMSVFERASGAYWKGNLKKYELSEGKLLGKNGVAATDESGALKDDVSDLWSSSNKSIDAVRSGGFSSKINPSSRKVLTDNGSSFVDITSATNGQLGVSSNADKIKLINFIKGIGTDGVLRHHMGDIIHSKPVQLMQDGDSVIFVGTNEGYLHAIQASTGEELFAYMPQELLKNIKPQFYSTAIDGHLYGVDAPITLFDGNNNGVQESNEDAAIFFGLRRGGKAYYALDVTNASNPSLKWKFTDSKLGYTWSQPTVAKLKYDGTTAKNVLIFGGGYIDDNHIDSNTPDTDPNAAGVGAAVYIVDADHGTLIKRITGPVLEHAVPSRIKVLDMDRDGSADRLYFADTGGNLLRVDLDPERQNNVENYKLTKLASLGGTGSNNRMFFNAPDVALFKRGGRVVLTISIGSGDRTKPLNDIVNNKFFMVMDENVYKEKNITSQNTTITDLYTAPLASSDNLIAEIAKANGKRGWVKDLNRAGVTGEKSLSSSITFQNKVMFTTFANVSVTTSTNNGVACGSSSNHKSSFYALGLLTGKAVFDLDGDGSINDTSDSIEDMNSGDIPETPQVILGDFKSSTGTDCTNTNCMREFHIRGNDGRDIAGSNTLAVDSVNTLPRVYWLEHDQ